MKVGGKITKLTEKEGSFMQMVIFMRESGMMIRHMVLVYIAI